MILLRRALPEDCELIFRLSNDPVVRAVSFQQDPISWDSHIAWYQQQIKDKRSVFYLAFHTEPSAKIDQFIAQIRFKSLNDEEYEVSLSLTQEYRGKGWGKVCLREALFRLKEETDVQRVRARIKKTNEVSTWFFLSLGFIPIRTQKIVDVSEFVLAL